jgi:hypothetical protein
MIHFDIRLAVRLVISRQCHLFLRFLFEYSEFTIDRYTNLIRLIFADSFHQLLCQSNDYPAKHRTDERSKELPEKIERSIFHQTLFLPLFSVIFFFLLSCLSMIVNL